MDSSFEDLVIGCVAENSPKYLAQAIRLVQSLRWFGGKLAGAECIVCVVEGIDAASRKELEKYSAKIRIVERFSKEHPQSNKLRFLQQDDVLEHKNILLLDCDTVVVQDPSVYFGGGFKAKIADAATVPPPVLERLFRYFQLHLPAQKYECTVTGEATIPYFNAGVLFFNGDAISELIPKWIEMNRRLIERIDLLANCSNFCEQASLSLALAATRTSFTALGNEINFPCHFENRSSRLENIDPIILHYHWLVDTAGYINPSPYPLVNRRIEQFNQRLRAEREKEFNNRLFWNFRYIDNPELGSGLGSRGEHRDYKRALLTDIVSAFRPHSILDIGCGDMEVSLALPAEGYTGIDISDIVIEKDKQSFPERTFLCGNFLDRTVAASDMVVCMDVLIHLSDYDYYRRFVEKIVGLTAEVGVIAGYEKDPEYKGIVFFHESLSETLRSCGVTEIKKIGEYRDTAIVQFLAPSCRRYVTHRHHSEDDKNKINFSDQAKRKQKAICILGMHRSGTSALARAVNLLGPYIGRTEQLMGPVLGDNPHGFWEHLSIFSFHERLLSFLSTSWDSIFPPPEGWWKQPEITPYREELKRLIQENFGDRRLWMWKDPRTSLLLPLWKEVMQELDIDVNYLLCVRNPLDVAASLSRRNNISKTKSFSLWFLYNASSLYWNRGVKHIVVRYEDLLQNWETILKRVSTAFQIPWPRDEEGFRKSMSAFLRPDERHSRSDDESVFKDGDVIRPMAKLYRLLLDMIGNDKISESESFAEEITSLYEDYCEYSRVFAPVHDGKRDDLPPASRQEPVSKADPRGEKNLYCSTPIGEILNAGGISSLVFPSFPSPRVTVIIPVWNHWEYSCLCLQSILANSGGVAYEVIVVDNGSTDRTEELLAKTKNIRVIRNSSNTGYLLACNQGAEAAQGDYIVFLNNDTEPLPGWLIELLNAADADQKTGAVGAKLIYPDGRLQEAGGMIFSDGRGWNFGNGDNPDEDIYNVECEVDYCSGACLLVRKLLFEALGGFDTRYAPAYYEETDLCFGLRKMGYKILYNPNAVVIHYESITAGRDSSGGFKRYIEINRWKFVEKWKDELTIQDAHPFETGRPPVTACRERLRRANLRPEDILDRMDDKREGLPQHPVPLISDISLLYRTLDEKISKSIEVIEKTAALYGREDVGIEWIGGEDSVVVLHIVRQAFGGTIPFCVIDMTSSADSSGKDDLLEKLREEWSFDLRKTNETVGLRAVITARRRAEKSQPAERLYFIREKTPRFIRVQPMLHFREVDVRQYIKKSRLPFGETLGAGSRVISPISDGKSYAGRDVFLSEFKAVISVEKAPSTLPVYTASSMMVKVTNASKVLWPAKENSAGGYGVSLSYHWIDKNGKIILFDGVRTPLTRSVAPWSEIVLDASIVTPLQPGEYSLEFDMVQEGVAWFKDRGSATASVAIIVEDRH